MKQKWLYILASLGALGATSCTPHVQVEPIKVEPIQVNVDVNLKVDRELDQFFDYQPPATQPATTTAPTTTQPTSAEKL